MILTNIFHQQDFTKQVLTTLDFLKTFLQFLMGIEAKGLWRHEPGQMRKFLQGILNPYPALIIRSSY